MGGNLPCRNRQTDAADLSDLLIVLIKWLAVFPVEESGDAHNFFLLVDNGQRQDVIDDKTRVVHSLFLKAKKGNVQTLQSLLNHCSVLSEYEH